MGIPQTLPANFSGFDKAGPPKSLPADFSGFDQAPAQEAKSPEVQAFEDQVQKQAIASVPKPHFLSFQPKPVDVLPTPFGFENQGGMAPVGPTRDLGPVNPSEIAGIPFGAAAPVGAEAGIPSASAQATRHMQQIATPGQRVAGSTGLASDIAEATSPVIGPAVLQNPVAMAKGLAEATIASKVAEKGARALGADEETTQNVSNLAWLLPLVLRAGLAPKVGVQSTPEGTAVTGSVRGAAAGAAMTPEEIILRAGLGSKKGEIRIPRKQASAPGAAESQMEAPTIEGETAQPPTKADANLQKLTEAAKRLQAEAENISTNAQPPAPVGPPEPPQAPVAAQPEAPKPVVTAPPQPAPAVPEAPRMPTGRPLTPEEIAVQQQPGTTGVAPDIANWQPPPELGVTSAPDYGQKARAEVEAKMGGPLKRNAEAAPPATLPADFQGFEQPKQEVSNGQEVQNQEGEIVKSAPGGGEQPPSIPSKAPVPAIEAAKPKSQSLAPAPGKVGQMNVHDLTVNPHKFQYKLSTDAEGVGTLLKDVNVFDPNLAGVLSVWKDPADGKTYVVNGHHRYELAKRTGQKIVDVKHIVAKDATTARAIGALQNIAEGRGTAVDAAKFFHDSGLTPEQLKDKGISLGEKTASDGIAMSRLDPSIFRKVVSGYLRQGTAVAIGDGTADHAQQAAILKQVERMERKGQKVSDSRIREFIRLANQTEKRTEETTSLFGTQQVERSLLWEKSAVSEYVQDQLKKDRKLFGFVSKGNRATELERGGNKIDVEKSKEISTGAAQAEEVYNKLSARGGPIASILDEAARKLADGEDAGKVKGDAYTRIRAEVSKTLQGSGGASAERPEGTSETPEASHPEGAIDLFSGAEPYKAPVFYSKAARVAFEKLPSSMSGDSALATLKNAGVKADEIKWIGLDDLLAGKPKVSKKDVLSHIMRNMVQIKEVSKGQRTAEQQEAIEKAKSRAMDASLDFAKIALPELRKTLDLSSEEAQEETRFLTNEIRTSTRSSAETLDGYFRSKGRQLDKGEFAFEPSKELLNAGRELFNYQGDVRRAQKNNQTPTKYASYTLPGEKQNYTELLLTLPPKPGSNRLAEGWHLSVMDSGEWTIVGPEGVGQRLHTHSHNEAMENARNYLEGRGIMPGRPQQTFSSGHFDESNILAHVRFDDRTDVGGKRVLFVEEVQSDWHQKGKKQGYDQRDLPAERKKAELRIAELDKQYPNDGWVQEKNARYLESMRGPTGTDQWRYTMPNGKSAEITYHPGRDKYILNADHGNAMNAHFATLQEAKHRAAQAGINPPSQGMPQQAQDEIQKLREHLEEIHRLELNPHLRGVPDAPFKSDWHELAMKRMLRAAAENGYDKLAWVTGEQTADRYDLGKHIDTLRYERDPFTNSYMLHAEKDGRELLAKDDVPASKLEEYVGKEVAQRIINNEGQKPDSDEAKDAPLARYLTGLQLKVGGEWAKNLYDRAIPNFISKVGKKWGAKVGETKINTSPTVSDTDSRADLVVIHDAGGQWGVYDVQNHTDPPIAEFDNEADAQQYIKGLAATESVHSIDVTPEMKKSLLEDGQPLFSSDLPPFPPSVAKDIQFSKVETKAGVSPYIRANPEALQAISRALGVNFLGVNLDKPSVTKVSDSLRRVAAAAEKNGKSKNAAAVKKLRDFADTLDKALDENPKHGVSIVREGKGEVATAHEELLHSVQRKGGEGYIPDGVPWKAALQDTGMARLAAERIVPQLVRAGISPHPSVVVAEGIVDIMRGDAADDMGPLEAEKAAEKYFEAALQQLGIEHLQEFKAVQDYIAEREEALDAEGKYSELAIGRQQYAVRAAGEAALARVLSRATRAANGSGGTELQGAANQGEGGARSGSSETSLSPQDNARLGRKRPASTSQKALYSTQPIGLTDEELADWAKSKGFRAEPAGEQLGMFGDNEPLVRVFSNGPRGREQRALVYQNQLDKLKESQAAAPTEPFSLTGAAQQDEQPRLFGAGDLGEIIGNPKAKGIELPKASRKEEDTGLFPPGPGAKNVGAKQEENPFQIEEVTKALKRIRETSPPEKVLNDAVSAVEPGQGRFAEALARAKAIGQGLLHWYTKGAIEYTNFDKALRSWEGAKQIAGREVKDLMHEAVKTVPDKLAREAIVNVMEAGGEDSDVLKKRAQQVPERFRKGYERAQHLTDTERAVANNFRVLMDHALDLAKKEGVLENGVEDYISHVWKKVPEKAERWLRKTMAELNISSLNPNPSFTRKRVWETYFDGEKYGAIPENKDAAYLVGYHLRSLYNAIADRAFIKGLFNQKASDGRPMAIVGGGVKIAEGGEAVLIKPQTKNAETGDYQYIHNPALRRWKWSGEDPESGKPFFMQGDVYVHPEIAGKLKNIFGTSAVRDFKIGPWHPGRTILGLSSGFKNVLLQGLPSLFHETTVRLHAAEHRVVPLGVKDYDLTDPETRELIMGGLKVFDGRGFQEFSEGLAPGAAMNKIPGIGPFYQWYGERLFEHVIPNLKVSMAKHALARNIKRYPNAPRERLVMLTADQANAAFGELNYTALARNNTLQDFLRMIFLAPDFFEARARFVGQAARPYGREQLVALVLGAAVVYTLARIMNQMFSKDPHFDRPFSFVHNGHEYSMRLIQGDVLHAIQRPGQFVMVRLHPTTTRTAIEALTGRNEQGLKRTRSEQFMDFVGRHVPIPTQSFVTQKGMSPARKAVKSALQTIGINEMKYRTDAERQALENRQPTVGNAWRRPQAEKMREYRHQIQENEFNRNQLDRDVASGEVTKQDRAQLKREAKVPGLSRDLVSMNLEDALDVWDKMNPDERARNYNLMRNKLNKELARYPEGAEKQELRTRVEAALMPKRPPTTGMGALKHLIGR